MEDSIGYPDDINDIEKENKPFSAVVSKAIFQKQILLFWGFQLRFLDFLLCSYSAIQANLCLTQDFL